MKIGTNDISKIYLGSAEIEKIYLGTEDVYESGDTPTPPAPSYDTQYLTIESTSDNNTIYWRSNVSNQGKTISASTDNGETWTTYTSSNSGSGTTIATLNTGDKVLVKGTNATYFQYAALGYFDSDGQFIVYGNIMSLVYGDNFSGQTTLTSGETFRNLFFNGKVASAENLILPATTLTQSCYDNMFQGCSNLTTAPSVLPATTLAQSCYTYMFSNCTNLTTVPTLPATTLASYCYQGMFLYCTSLTTAPELPATTLAQNCYASMFNGCSSLNSITCLATDISATNCTGSWVDGVSATGSFFVPTGNPASWQCGIDGVPSDWTIEDTNGDTYECTGGGEPSTDVPLDNSFAVKVNGVWDESYDPISYINDIQMCLNDMGIDSSDVEELAIGNRTFNINLDGESWDNCTGLTLAQSVTETDDIHNFLAMQWVNVKANDLNYMGISGLFSDMNCCPIYVPEDYMWWYQSSWHNEITEDCDGDVADRLVAWETYIDPNS